jgi:hypothetical protein
MAIAIATIETKSATSHRPARDTTDSMSLPSQEMSDFIRLVAFPQCSIDPDQICRSGQKMPGTIRKLRELALNQC